MYELPELPYDYDYLEPVVDAKTMEIHHTKHHQTYVDKLNDALKDHPDLMDRPVEELLGEIDKIPASLQGAVINHGGGHHNHTLFWFSLHTGDKPASSEFQAAVEEQFGSMDDLIQEMKTKGAAHFGSGWVWLVQEQDKLRVITTANQDSPLIDGFVPLLGIDLWEHAYYLTYQNRRPEYLDKIFTVVCWEAVSDRYNH